MQVKNFKILLFVRAKKQNANKTLLRDAGVCVQAISGLQTPHAYCILLCWRQPGWDSWRPAFMGETVKRSWRTALICFLWMFIVAKPRLTSSRRKNALLNVCFPLGAPDHALRWLSILIGCSYQAEQGENHIFGADPKGWTVGAHEGSTCQLCRRIQNLPQRQVLDTRVKEVVHDTLSSGYLYWRTKAEYRRYVFLLGSC